MKNKRMLLYFMTVFSALVISCEKDPVPDPVSPTEPTLPTTSDYRAWAGVYYATQYGYGIVVDSALLRCDTVTVTIDEERDSVLVFTFSIYENPGLPTHVALYKNGSFENIDTMPREGERLYGYFSSCPDSIFVVHQLHYGSVIHPHYDYWLRRISDTVHGF